MPDATHELVFKPLLAYLSHERITSTTTWREWSIAPIFGGANNLVYRATSEHGDFAVKYAIADERNRAYREYHALAALTQAGYALAPRPVLLDLSSSALPIVVQTWLDGPTLKLPMTDHDWKQFVQHLTLIHALTPAQTTVSLPEAVLNADSAQTCRQFVQRQINLLPGAVQPSVLHELAQRLQQHLRESWPTPPVALCRVDPNPSNFVCRPEQWASVDWENSGWGDPAFDIANVMTHPAYFGVSPARWHWFIETYALLVNDEMAIIRIHTYYKTLLVWWIARLARMLYEVPQGGDRRLAARADDWEQDICSKYSHYVELADLYL